MEYVLTFKMVTRSSYLFDEFSNTVVPTSLLTNLEQIEDGHCALVVAYGSRLLSFFCDSLLAFLILEQTVLH